MPALPQNSSSKTAKGKSKIKSQSKKGASWKGLTFDDLKNIDQKIKEHFKWNHCPRQFQLDAVKAQLQSQWTPHWVNFNGHFLNLSV